MFLGNIMYFVIFFNMRVIILYNFLIKRFIKNSDNLQSPTVREAYGTFAGFFGIFTNIVLFLLKLTIGLLSGSVSIIADSVNNLADSGSSILTIVGFRLSSKPADDDHPYGHARMEYLTGLGISVLVIIIGFEMLTASFEKLFSPELPSFSFITLIVLLLSVFLKLFQGEFYKKVGRLIKSDTLHAAYTDSFNDAISTSAVFISTLITFFTSIVLDGYIGIAVSLFIIYSGIKLVIETANPLIGTTPDRELVEKISEKIHSYDVVLGIHDLIIHSYGAEKCFASVHVEVDASANILDVHDCIDVIEKEFLQDLGICLVIHMDPIVNDSEEVNSAKAEILKILAGISDKITMHDFRVVFGNTHTNLIFDVCIPYSFHMSEEELRLAIECEAKKINPEWCTVITVDRDFNNLKG